ncbi:hypothetical protein AB1Y20_005997 [Prymnesium parvum]|uniref:Cleft lip and palate transmembrane protein 1 n=1 Tax=Prymnesium parvum TaxID=97485 RepID=A0AB34J1B8_PRYPA
MLHLLLCCAWAVAGVSGARARPTHFENSFSPSDVLDLRVFLSPTVHFTMFNDTSALKWFETDIPYDMAAEERSIELQIPTSDHLRANHSMFAHTFMSKKGAAIDPKDPAYDRWSVTHNVFSLTTAGERLKPLGLYKLLTGEPAPWEEELRRGAAADAAAGRQGVYVPYWKPKLYLQLIIDHEERPLELMPYTYEQYLRANRLLQGHRFRPLIYVNELMVMKMHWVAINESLPTLPLEVTFKPLPAHRFQWMVNLQSTFKVNEETLGITEKESEDMRGMFVNTNPVLLYTTVAVSAVHLLFDVLAFKNDVAFWRSVDTMEGLSSRTLVLNQIMELVILLYLREQDSSWLVQISSFFTLVLGVFKIFKSFTVKKLDAAKSDGEESITDKYDKLAFRYLSPPLLLLVVCYSLWSLVFHYHRGWYAWLLESLVALVYGGGFIVMTPQLFINYRLKSVAHLPWKFFMYKALNTFIDDLFAFIIKMPTLHRMSCFRDDIVFAIFLYQRWVYRVDMSRVNEFGHRGEAENEEGKEDDNVSRRAQHSANLKTTEGEGSATAKRKTGKKSGKTD